jgi:DUF1365 family protein
MTAALFRCVVRHARTGPVRHGFAQRTYQWFVDVDDLPRLPMPLRPLARFQAGDHLGDPAATIRANVDAYLALHGIDLGGGPIRMLTNARVFGYVFNPLSVFWCHRADDSLACVIAEVHNTYGERHCYLLRPDGSLGRGGVNRYRVDRYRVDKEFYVSPFYEVAGVYRMRLPEPADELAISIELTPPGGDPFVATLAGRRTPASPATVVLAAIRYPWVTAVVSLRIRWHGIRLYLRGLPVVPRPVHHAQERVQ